MQPMLAHADSDRRQLCDLVARRFGVLDTLQALERVRARAAALGPVLDDLVDQLGWEQPSVPTLVTWLAATSPTRALPARPRRRRGRILRGRQRRVARAAVQPPLELGHPRLEPLVCLEQLTHAQQQRDSRLTVTIEDRLGLGSLHTTTFVAGTEVPSPGERLRKSPALRVFCRAL
jgi:hypothetical protein